MAPSSHPLGVMIADAAAGRFPAVDGGWQRVPQWRPGLEAVFAFTGHAVLAIGDDVSQEFLAGFEIDGFGAAHDPRLISALAGPAGWIDSLDLVLARLGTGSGSRSTEWPALVLRPDLRTQPRAQRAIEIRDEPVIFGYPDPARSAVAIVARGLGGLTELSFELEPDNRGTGAGTILVQDAVSLVPAGELVVAGVAPGNVASLRSLLNAGFTPLGSVQLFHPSRSPTAPPPKPLP